MIKKGFEMSCSEAFIGDSFCNSNKEYLLYYREFHKDFCRRFFKRNYGQSNCLLPDIFDLDLLQKHNFIIHSSVMLKKSLLDKVGVYNENIPLHGKRINGELLVEDWDLWKRILKHTKCLNVNEPLVYYGGRFKLKEIIKNNYILSIKRCKKLINKIKLNK